MSEIYPKPPEGSLHRHFYERAMREGYPVDAFSTQVDAQIENYQHQATQFKEEGATPHELFYGLVDIAEQMEADIRTFLYEERDDFAETYGRPFKETVSSLRLGLLERSVEPHLIWPVMAKFGRDHREAKKLREELAEAMYGIMADYLDFLTSPSSQELDFEKGTLRGGLNEFTGIGLVNRRAGGNRIALLGSLAEDYRKKIDFHHYRFNGDPNEIIDIPVQVRSKSRSFLSAHALDTLRHVKVLTAEDMGNHYDRHYRRMNFQTIHDMVAEIEGTATQATSNRLDTILARQAFRSILLGEK